MKTIALTLLLTLGLLAPASADDKPFPRTISVSGEGKVSAPPDIATINSGVTTTATTAGAALDANSKSMEAVMATLKNLGVADKDIQTSNFNVTPEYQRDQPRGQRPKIVGYRVSNNLDIRVRDLGKLGSLLDALVESGSNQVSGIRFSIDEPEALIDEARRKAVLSARNRAELYAEAAGVTLGKILTISEQSVNIPRPQAMPRMAMAMADSSVPIATGEQTLRTSINILFAIE